MEFLFRATVGATSGDVVTKEINKPTGNPVTLRIVSMLSLVDHLFGEVYGYLENKSDTKERIGVFDEWPANLAHTGIVFDGSIPWPDNFKLVLKIARVQDSGTEYNLMVGYDIKPPEEYSKPTWGD